MKILVTGASGFVGGYLVRLLLEHKHEVVTLSVNNPDAFQGLPVRNYEVDILNYETVEKSMNAEIPDAVMHLAAISNVPLSWSRPELTVDVNVKGTLNVLEALMKVNPKATFLNIGSSDEYGLSAKLGKPLAEDTLCQPQNPYSISKLCAEQMALQLGKKNQVKVIQVRAFNHFGPGQAKGFVTTDFASQIADIEKGKQEPVIKVGDLSAYRDFSFVADVVNAYVMLLENNVASGVYNVCSGKAISIQEILDTLVLLSTKDIKVEVDANKLRPSEVSFFVGDNTKLKAATGWIPQYDFKQGMKEVLDYWRSKE